MAHQHSSPQVLGFTPSTPGNGNATTALNAAANWCAYSFTPDASRTVSKVRVFTSAVGGTLGANDLTCDIYSDAAGIPNASLSSTNVVTATPTGAATVEFTGLAQAVVAGIQYWIVLKNVNGTPATNFPTYQHGSSNTGSGIGTAATTWGRHKVATVNSGVAWATALRVNSWGWRVEFADGTFVGEPITNLAQSSGAAGNVYLTRESGVVLVTGNATLNVRGIAMPVMKIASPTGDLRFRLYNGTTLLATTATIPLANMPTSASWLQSYFSATQVIPPGTTLRAVMGATAGGDVTNAFQTSEYTINNDANSKALFPFATPAQPTNAAKKTYFDGSSWTDTDTVIIAFGLLLDSDAEFGAGGSHFVA